MDRQLLELVASDLDHIALHWLQANPTPEQMRRDTPTLRRLLVDSEKLLALTWREVGFRKTPIIPAPHLGILYGEQNIVRMELAFASTMWLEGQVVPHILTTDNPKYQMLPYKKDRRDGFKHPYRLEEFMESISLVVDGCPIRRREVIKYVANELGGVHYTLPSRTKFASIRLLDREIDHSEGPQIRHTTIDDQHPIYAEMLGTVRLILLSQDVQKLRLEIQKLGIA